ncbi:MAG: sulfur carrier protein ThiS [Chloroflexi bacterium]|nr:sulfur carrier protein ThiS [Chloroflexota bacterium]
MTRLAMIALTVNGKPEHLEEGTLLMVYLGRRGLLGGRRIAIGYNGEVVHKDHWPDVTLRQSDVLDIVHMVGGG